MKRLFTPIHWLALAALFINAAMSLIGVFDPNQISQTIRIISFFGGICLWGLLIVKIWKRPRQWGPGVGVFLLLVIGLQTFLWTKAMEYSQPEHPGLAATLPDFLLYEIPLVLGAVCCLLLGILPAKDRR